MQTIRIDETAILANRSISNLAPFKISNNNFILDPSIWNSFLFVFSLLFEKRPVLWFLNPDLLQCFQKIWCDPDVNLGLSMSRDVFYVKNITIKPCMFWPWCSQKWTWILVIFPWKFRIHIHTIISKVQSNFLHFYCAPERSSLYSEKDVFWLPSSLRLIDKFWLIRIKIYVNVSTILSISLKCHV